MTEQQLALLHRGGKVEIEVLMNMELVIEFGGSFCQANRTGKRATSR
jgi:hypothetical protein